MSAPGLFALTGRTAVVTGAGSGLGQAIAVGMADAGARVVCLDIREQAAQETARRIADARQEAIAVHADVTDPDAVQRACDEAVARFGTLDVLVNSAGVTNHVPAEEFPLGEWDRIMGINLRGLFICCQAAGRIMIRQRRGSIINLSSIAGEAALGRGNSAFCASKGGVVMLTKELAIEWGQYNVRVNAIAPCQFLTPALEEVLADPQFDPKALMARWLADIPLGRIGLVEDIVGPAIFLASEAAAMVTGHVLHVDGGFLAR